MIEQSDDGIPLATTGDCERSLAKILRQVYKGTLDPKVGHSLIIGIGTLAKMMRETRTEQAIARLERLEKARGRAPDAVPTQAH